MKNQIFKSFAEDRYAYLKEAYDPDRDPHGRGPDAFKVSEKPRVGQQVVTNDGVSGTIDEIRGEDIIVVDEDGGEHIVSSEQISIEVAEDYDPDQHSTSDEDRKKTPMELSSRLVDLTTHLENAKQEIKKAEDLHTGYGYQNDQPLFEIDGMRVDVIDLIDETIEWLRKEN